MNIELTINHQSFKADMDGVGQLMWQGFRKGLDKAGSIAVVHIRDKAPVRTGRLRRAIYHRLGVGGDTVNIFADYEVAPYFNVIDQGHPQMWIISAKSNSALRFRVNGKIVFAKWVVHPGVPTGKEFVAEGLEEARDDIIEVLENSVLEEMISGRTEGGFVKRPKKPALTKTFFRKS